jgi:hypothetical protein
MNSKSTPIKVTGKRSAPLTPTQSTNSATSASPVTPSSPNKVRKQQPMEITVLVFNAIAIAVMVSHAFPM